MVSNVDERSTVADGYLSMEGGVDSGFAASLLQPNEVAWAVNATCRGGFLKPRPGWKYRRLSFKTSGIQSNFQNGLFQGAGTYVSDNDKSYLMASVGGRVFKVDLDDFTVGDISIPGSLNSSTKRHAWFEQAENTLVVQNMTQAPLLWNGVSSRRSNVNTQVPVGGPMAYLKGRLWVARGREFFGGDLVNSYPDKGRESVIEFQENDFLNEGGSFTANGTITGMAVAANIDTQLGDGDLLIFTRSRVFAFNAPADRDKWKNLRYPIQRVALTTAGTYSSESIVNMNKDLMFRSGNGINSFRYAQSDFEQWGNTPISRQVDRALRSDNDIRLSECSAVNFDNRMLMTVQPQWVAGHGMVHKGLVALDYHLVSGMGRKTAPAWEGVWTGLRILRVLTIEHRSVTRCFAFALDDETQIVLWELTKAGHFDVGVDGDDIRIPWTIETKAFTYGQPRQIKKLSSLEQWYDQLVGQLNVEFYFRSNLSECWTPWAAWSACAKYRDCDPPAEGECHVPKYLRQQVRPRMALPMAPDVVDVQTGGFRNQGYDFQVRMTLLGHARIGRLISTATMVGDPSFGDIRNVTCVDVPTGVCDAGNCKELACCDPDDYGNLIASASTIFGYVTGRVYLVTEGEDDTGFSGIELRLHADTNNDGAPDGEPIDVAVTASNGLYGFSMVPVGAYVVVCTPPEGYEVIIDGDSTADTGGSPADAPNVDTEDTWIPVNIAAGETDSGNDYSIMLVDPVSGSISGTVLLVDDDMVYTGHEGATVELYEDPDDDGNPEGAAVATTVTGGDGRYNFNSLHRGSFVVKLVIPDDFALVVDGDTIADTAGSPTDFPNSDSGDGRIPVTLRSAESDTGNDFTIESSAVDYCRISGFVFEREIGIPDTPMLAVQVRLHQDLNGDGVPDGVVVATVNTDANGFYLFEGITVAAYVIECVAVSPYVCILDEDSDSDTPPDPSDSANIDPDDLLIPVHPHVNETDSGNDFYLQNSDGYVQIDGIGMSVGVDQQAEAVQIDGIGMSVGVDQQAEAVQIDGIGMSVLSGQYDVGSQIDGIGIVIVTMET